MLLLLSVPEANTKLGPFAVFGAAAWAVGCLPGGAPPVGQHVVHDRTLAGVYFVPSEVAGIPSRVLALGPLRPYPRLEGDSRRDLVGDLYHVLVPEPPSTAAALDQAPIITDFVLPKGAADTYRLVSDSLGRPVYLRCPGSPYDVAERFDWATGRTENLGDIQECWDEGFRLSPGRTRVTTGWVTELGGTSHSSFIPCQNGFVGEDFYFVADAPWRWLARSKPGGIQRLLASTDNLGMAAVQGDRTPQILVCLSQGKGIRNRPPCGSGYTPFALLDTDTLAMSPLPFHVQGLSYFSASDNGHWLLFTTPPSPDAANRDLVLHDWTTGETARSASFPNLGLALGTSAAAEWRPGRDEVWVYFFLGGEGFATWKPESGFVTRVRGNHPVAVRRRADGRSSVFTRDGAHYFSMPDGQPVPVHVGPADDLTAPVFPIQPAGTWLGAVWETKAGGLLVGAYTFDFNRQDLSIVDPATGVSRAITGGGHVLELGHSRALAIVSWESTRRVGDLVLVDLATGEQTLLAENAYAAAVDPGVSADVAPEADRLRSGTRVAFLTRSRFESPYDGLWVTTLP